MHTCVRQHLYIVYGHLPPTVLPPTVLPPTVLPSCRNCVCAFYAPQDALEDFDWEPRAAASIGQVHAAHLKDGRRVALKVGADSTYFL